MIRYNPASLSTAIGWEGARTHAQQDRSADDGSAVLAATALGALDLAASTALYVSHAMLTATAALDTLRFRPAALSHGVLAASPTLGLSLALATAALDTSLPLAATALGASLALATAALGLGIRLATALNLRVALSTPVGFCCSRCGNRHCCDACCEDEHPHHQSPLFHGKTALLRSRSTH